MKIAFIATIAIATVTAGGLLAPQGLAGASAQDVLLWDVGSVRSKASSPLLERAHRRARVRFNSAAMGSAKALRSAKQLRLRLFDKRELIASQLAFDERTRNSYSWFGRIADDATSHVIVSVTRGHNAAISVGYGGRRYVGYPSLDGLMELAEIDVSRLPDGDDTPPPFKPPPLPNREDYTALAELMEKDRYWDGIEPVGRVDKRIVQYNPDFASQFGLAKDDGSEIDIMVMFSSGVRELFDPDGLTQAHAAMSSSVQLAVDYANLTFWNSSIPTRLNLVVQPFLIDYDEYGIISDDLLWLRNTGDGELDAAHVFRDVFAADIVTLITLGGTNSSTGREACGIAFYNRYYRDLQGNAAHGFNVIDVECLPATTFVHEYGHNLGADHDNYVNSGQYGIAPYARGYVLPPPTSGDGSRTIMAYKDECVDGGWSCPRIPYWSDPDRQVNGEPIGIPFVSDPGAADNHRAITQPALNGTSNLYDVANYRQSVCRVMSLC